jgi:hypothetical protein
VAPASSFIVFKGARVTFVVKRWNGKRTKEKNKKCGIGCGRLPSYLVGAVSPVAQRCNRHWSFGLSIRWCNTLWSCFVLCASVSSRMGGTCALICVERGVGGIVVVTPVAVEVCILSWWSDRGNVGSERGSHAPVHRARSCPSYRREWVPWWGPPWLSALPEGSTCPSDEAEVYQEGQALPCLRCRSQARWKSFPTGRRGRALWWRHGVWARREASLSLERFSLVADTLLTPLVGYAYFWYSIVSLSDIILERYVFLRQQVWYGINMLPKLYSLFLTSYRSQIKKTQN